MVLRDTYINSIVCHTAILLLLLMSACKQTPADTTGANAPHSDPSSEVQKEKEKAAGISVIPDRIQFFQNQLDESIQEMNDIRKAAADIRAGGKDEKNTVSKDGADAVYEKSSTVTGAMYIVKGSLNEVGKQFSQGVLDEKQAQDMIHKLNIDFESYQNDIQNYKKMLGEPISATGEKK